MSKLKGRQTKAPPPSEQDAAETPVLPLVTPVTPEEEPSILPPFIVTNQREKMEPEYIDQIKLFTKRKEMKITKFNALIFVQHGEEKEPIPKHPIALSWWPRELCFRLDKKPVIRKLSISNRSPKIMYVHCCGLWEDTARLGASWRLYPRTRILLAPGLVAEMFIKAKPREESPVPYAYAGLQLAAAHRKDTVFGYFVVPIGVHFDNYVAQQYEGEGEGEQEK